MIDVFLISALMIHSIQPGPLLFTNNPELVWAMMTGFLVSNVLMFGIMVLSARYLSRLMYVPRSYLMPVVATFCIVGAYALDNTTFDVWVMLGFGVLGFFMERARIPLGPFIIGFILAPLAEQKMRTGLMATAGDFMPIFTRPMSATFLAITVLLLVWPFINGWRRKMR